VRDVLGVRKMQYENPDFAYFDQMAARFSLADLLQRMKGDAGPCMKRSKFVEGRK